MIICTENSLPRKESCTLESLPKIMSSSEKQSVFLDGKLTHNPLICGTVMVW